MHGLKVLVVACAVATSAVEAQDVDGMRAGVRVQARTDSVLQAPANLAAGFRPSPQWRKYAPIASAIVPGSGQALLGDNRFVGYVAVEALAWWMYAKDVSEPLGARESVQGTRTRSRACSLQHDVPRRGMVVLRVDA